MSRYYTTMQVIDNKFIGTVFEASTNREVYKTEPHATQLEAVRFVDKFLATEAVPSNSELTTSNPPVITNTYVKTPTPSNRRCCGR